MPAHKPAHYPLDIKKAQAFGIGASVTVDEPAAASVPNHFLCMAAMRAVFLHRGDRVVELAEQRMVLGHHEAVLLAGLDALHHAQTLHFDEGKLHAGNVADRAVDPAGIQVEQKVLLGVVALDLAEAAASAWFSLDQFSPVEAERTPTGLPFMSASPLTAPSSWRRRPGRRRNRAA